MSRSSVLALLALPLIGCDLVSAQPAYQVTGDDMLPGMQNGDLISVSAKGCPGVTPKVGDVVGFIPPSSSFYSAPFGPKGEPSLGRVVAGPGDRVAIVDGRLIVNGVAVPVSDGPPTADAKTRVVIETLPGGGRIETLDHIEPRPEDAFAEQEVGPGQWFILGDNRDDSFDSRTVGPLGDRLICWTADKIVKSADPQRRGQAL